MKNIVLLLLVLSSVAVDQITKNYAQNNLLTLNDPNDPKFYYGKKDTYLELGQKSEEGSSYYFAYSHHYVRNQGAAWGTFSNLDDKVRDPIFFTITFFAMLLILNFYRTTPPSHYLVRTSLALIFSGAIGNFIDRFRYRYVIDWINVEWQVGVWYYDFPTFNFADSAITIGLSLLIIDMIFFEKKRLEREKTEKINSATLMSENQHAAKLS